MTLFFPPRFNLGVLEKAHLDIFKAESHAFRTHDSLEWEYPLLCCLTLISQTKSGLWKPSWEATKPQALSPGTCGMHSFGCFSFFFLCLPTTPSLTVSNVYTFNPLSFACWQEPGLFPSPSAAGLALRLRNTHPRTCLSLTWALPGTESPSCCASGPPQLGGGIDTEQRVNFKTGTHVTKIASEFYF